MLARLLDSRRAYMAYIWSTSPHLWVNVFRHNVIWQIKEIWPKFARNFKEVDIRQLSAVLSLWILITNSVLLLTPGEREALAKSKPKSGQRWVVILADLKNMAVCQEWDKQDFNFQKHIFGKSPFTQWALKHFLFEGMRRIDLLWEIVKYRASLLWMFNVYEFCWSNLLRKTCPVKWYRPKK
jgi:hypothetical protein